LRTTDRAAHAPPPAARALRRLRRIVMSGVTLVAFALAVPQAHAQEDLATLYRLGSGDKVRITVYGEPDLSGEFEVDSSGSVSLPLVGEVRAGGQNLREFERSIVEVLSDGYLVDPRVAVEVLNYRPFYIIGEVNNPGRYPYVTGMTLINAVAMAGGYTYRARQGRAEIRRGAADGESDGDGQVMNINDESMVILPGDVIRIPERFF
jgi:protein involved in polysaccharide export with SLBB domain